MKRKNESKDFLRTIVLVGFDGAAALDISGPYEVFGAATHLLPDASEPPYRLILLAYTQGVHLSYYLRQYLRQRNYKLK